MPVGPNFFEEVDATGIVENHIKQVLGLEEDQATSILSSYQEIRKDLVDRLSGLPRGSFTAQHLRGTLAQIEGAIGALNSGLHGAMAAEAEKTALLGIDHSLKELAEFDDKFTGAVTPVNVNAALLAKDTSQFLLTKYKTNLDQYGAGLLSQISNGLFEASLGAATTDEIVGRISKGFKGEEWKLTRIVRTELHHIYNVGRLNSMIEMSDEIDDLQKALIHPMDGRTGPDSIYAARLALVVDVDKPFRYSWKGQVREYMVPPDRPNDRSAVIPYRAEWGSDRGPAFVGL